MAIQFGDDTSYLIYAQSVAADLAQKTVFLRLSIDGIQADNFPNLFITKNDNATVGFYLGYYGHASDLALEWKAYFSGTDGVWRVNSTTLTVGTRYTIAVAYDNSLTTNDPVIYLNGVSQTVTEIATPTGTSGSDSGNYLVFSSAGVSGYEFYGKLEQALIYNRILTSAEILDIHNSRKAIPDWRGLVFAPHLCGAASLQTFDGTTLSATNYIVDQVSGAQGAPTGSPIGRGDTYLTFDN